MVGVLSTLIEPLDDLIQMENSLSEDDELWTEIRELKENRHAFNAETEQDIASIQEDIALNELKLKTLQKETMN